MNSMLDENSLARARVTCFLGLALLAPACGSSLTADALTATSEQAPVESATAPVVAAARGPELGVAMEAAQAALDTCRAQGFAVSASVVDSAGILKVLLAADGAAPRGVQSSTNKAITAIIFKASTRELGERAKADKFFAATLATHSNYNVRAGGVLLAIKGEVIGALGVGGGHPSEVDEACAKAGAAHVREQL